MPYDITHALQNTVPIFTATTHRHHKTRRQTDISWYYSESSQDTLRLARVSKDNDLNFLSNTPG